MQRQLPMGEVDLSTTIGQIVLPNPVMTASGTAGHGAELSAYVDLGGLGAMVVKSLSPFPWEGNPAPRVRGAVGGMINSVGLQNPGVEAWCRDELPELRDNGARVVASIWGRTVADYRAAADALRGVEGIIAVEINVSCPNLEDRKRMFSHDADAAAAVVEAVAVCELPRWVKLSPNVTDIVAIAEAVSRAGADAVTLTNTVMGLVIDIESRLPVLGAGVGALSGPPIRPVALRAVYEVHAALPDLPIIGVGGIATSDDAVQFLMAGARAIQVGTATFADPRASTLVLRGLTKWCGHNLISSIEDIIGAAHDH